MYFKAMMAMIILAAVDLIFWLVAVFDNQMTMLNAVEQETQQVYLPHSESEMYGYFLALIVFIILALALARYAYYHTVDPLRPRESTDYVLTRR